MIRKALCILMLCALTGCAVGSEAGSESSAVSTEATTEPTTEATTEVTTEADTEETESLTPEEAHYMDMISRSLISTGNNARMKSVIEKAKAGEEITIAYIGGSITEGYNAGTKEIYAKLSYEYFADTYSSRDKVKYVNAGLSGTPSTLGLIRSDRDVFDYDPDILFIEFAVNDGGVQDSYSFDNLIYKALSRRDDAAVVLLFSVIESGYTRQDAMSATGFYYGLPMISMKNAIWPEIENGNMTWKDWSKDESHPNEYGQKVYADFIKNYYKTIDGQEKDNPVELPSATYNGKVLYDVKMYDNTNFEMSELGSFENGGGNINSFKLGWSKADTATDNEPMVFEFDGKELFMVYKDTKSSKYGTAEIYVDGEKVISLKGNSSDGWNNPVVERVYSNADGGKHTVSIKMQEGDEDKNFSLLCIGMN